MEKNNDARLKVLEDRVGQIASRITLWEPFLSAIFPLMERRFHEEKGITAYTNGRIVGFGLDFCEGLNNEELMFLCLHESMHVILMHIWRRDGRDPALFNIACDAVINRTLLNRKYTMPSEGVLIDWVTEEMGSEEVYAKLMHDAPKQKQKGKGEKGDGSGQGDEEGEGGGSGDQPGDPNTGHSGGGGWDGTGDMAPPADAADAANMEAAILTAAKMSKACGDSSSLVDRILGGGLNPSVPWTEVLRDIVTQIARNDYSYRRPNRRMLQHGVLLPTLRSEEMGGLIIGVDTSGSIGPVELDQIAAEINAIASDCNPSFVEVVYCDTKIAGTERFESQEPIVLHPKGGGGTRFEPMFEYAKTVDGDVAALIYLTDLCGNVDECEQPDYPVIWACTYRSNDGTNVPFGTVVPVTL